ncbi:MAG TPA: hypothetical protein VGC90_09160, partial [Candidatus Limnocylindrales bacterium]
MPRLGRLFGREGGGSPYLGLRAQVLHLDPATLAIPEGDWMGASVALMEMALRGGTASLVAVADGTVSLYISTGGGTLGAGERPAVRAAAKRFLRAASDAASSMTAATEFPLPEAGHVRFHVRTPEGDVTAGAPEDAVRARRHPLSPLYMAGQDVITEIRVASEARG